MSNKFKGINNIRKNIDFVPSNYGKSRVQLNVIKDTRRITAPATKIVDGWTKAIESFDAKKSELHVVIRSKRIKQEETKVVTQGINKQGKPFMRVKITKE